MRVSVLKGFARHGVRLALLFVCLSVMVGVSHAQAAGAAAQPAAKAVSPAATPAKAVPAAQAERQRGGNHEGIKVRGHWTIEVRDPDGTVRSHAEFENSLQGPGQILLANLLSGQASFGGWAVVLSGPPTSPAELPCGNSAGLYACYIYSPPVSNCATATANCFPTLTISPSSYQNAATGTPGVTLQGTAVAGNNSGVVGSVTTYMAQCVSTVAPGNCSTANGNIQLGEDWVLNNAFTSRNLDGVNGDPSPVSVTTGQTIAVSVTFSFQ
jgi:hypothetical protein